jgi:hypothetical protein
VRRPNFDRPVMLQFDGPRSPRPRVVACRQLEDAFRLPDGGAICSLIGIRSDEYRMNTFSGVRRALYHCGLSGHGDYIDGIDGSLS